MPHTLLFALVVLLTASFAGLARAEPRTPAQMPWQDATYDKDLPATLALSRPEPGEGGWHLWMRHHENRKKWVAENKVDLLMVGDSIVFGWSRVGKAIWAKYYADSNAVNIGSSGDRTYHMLWHLQNGGLDGMREHNPKVVLVMMGTNNRGEPAKQGADTAYGVLALLKEIHARLPQSKILLMAILSSGEKPDDPGRLRNREVNAILKTYADEQTVHWLDIGDHFLNDDDTIKRELLPDALHPNEAGYQVWAEALKPKLDELMGDR